MAFTRHSCLDHLNRVQQSGAAIVGAGAGTGLSAKCAEMGGADLIIIYNSGRFRMAGRGSLAGLMPYGDANAIVVEMSREVLPVVRKTPVLAGICGTDPFRLMDVFLKELKRIGFSGVQNFPTVGLCDGLFRTNLEETGMGYDLEVEMIALAHELDMLTTPYVFSEEDAKKMTKAGADVLVAHAGLTTNGTVGARSGRTIDETVSFLQAVADAAKSEREDILVICHGGPLAEPEQVEYVLRRTAGISGFFGASSVERLPTEFAITDQVRRFKNLAFAGAVVANDGQRG